MPVNVKIYLGPGYRAGEEGSQEIWGYLSRAVEECLIPMGCICDTSPGREDSKFCSSRHGCDILYGEFFDGDSRAEEFRDFLNQHRGICAKLDFKVQQPLSHQPAGRS